MQRKARIRNALNNLKTMLTKKKLEVDENAFRLLLFNRNTIEAQGKSFDMVSIFPDQ